MFCPKCHTELLENDIVCRRCKTEIQSNNKFSFGSFSSSKTFSRMNHKYLNDNSHEEQYEYNKEYSNILVDNNESHKNQYEYNKNYSNIKKDNNDPHESQYKYSEDYSKATTDIITSDEDYQNAFIGNNRKTLKTDNYSLGSLLFGPFYLLYRKVYPQAIILIIIYMILSAYTQNSIDILIKIMINIVLCIKFKSIYLNHVERTTTNIKNTNPDRSSNEIIELCRKAGGTLSIKTVSFIFIVYLIIICAYNFSLNIEEENTPSNEIDNLIYNVTPNTKQYSYTDSYKSYGDGYCHITIQVNRYTRYHSEIEYLNEINNYLDNKSSITKKTYNNYTWYNQMIEEENGDIYDINAILYNNKIYEISFLEQKIDACNETKEFIMSTTRFH